MIPLVIVLLKKELFSKRSIVLLLSMLIITSAFFGVDYYKYNSEEWKEVKSYNQARHDVIDVPMADYDNYENEYKKIGVSRNDYSCLNINHGPNYVHADKTFFSTKKLKEIASILPTNEKYNFNVFSWIKKIF